LSVLRGFGMKGKSGPMDIYFKFFTQSINTPGNEITPGSDVI
jgi:hypothetical protein